ncbi:ABC transporter ATP-binding protein [Enterocloster bolteae]|uniref:ABC transporter ATP-binding protein n=1 Tax=Enterocloster bolteae TaxID=208479 RepID=UPI000E451026|nr:ABC transporter ATP-binding protein [Enterocloster bolteae]RGK78212.1 ABC transporter ATP-binding protein [Enterocloster bolteae]
MIEVKNLVKDYGGHLAVDHLSFRVEDGQIYGFLGPNGAGKSTTMNIMTGYLGATEGQVIIDGHDILEEPEAAKKRIGYLPEIPPLYMDMTVDEYLEFAACLKKLPKAGQKDAIQEVMELVKITDVRKRLIRNLSKGYRQRVGMAQAILGKPSVIILDEPTVGLDPKQIIEIRDMIKGLGKQHTVILSSHILSEVSAVCDHIMIIAHGKLIASDTPENLEQRLKGAAGLELTVKGSEETVMPVLEEIHGLSIERIGAGGEAGTCVVNLQFGGDEDSSVLGSGIAPGGIASGGIASGAKTDIRETIFYALANHRLPILSMAPSKASLEEIFLELTEDSPKLREDRGVTDPTDPSKEEDSQ